MSTERVTVRLSEYNVTDMSGIASCQCKLAMQTRKILSAWSALSKTKLEEFHNVTFTKESPGLLYIFTNPGASPRATVIRSFMSL